MAFQVMHLRLSALFEIMQESFFDGFPNRFYGGDSDTVYPQLFRSFSKTIGTQQHKPSFSRKAYSPPVWAICPNGGMQEA